MASNSTALPFDKDEVVDVITGFIHYMNSTLNATENHVNATENATLSEETIDPEVQDFGASVKSLGLTSIIVISVACILAFGTGCFCALKRTRRKATKIVSIRSIGTISSQNSLEENKSPKKAQTPSPAATEYHTPKPPESQPRCPPHTHTSYMWNPMCTIDCTSHACHGAGAAAGVEGSVTGHEGSDNGERTIHITLSNSKIFGQSNSCSQFPDF